MENSETIFKQLQTTMKSEAKSEALNDLFDLMAWDGCKDDDAEAMKAWEKLKSAIGINDAGLMILHLIGAAIKSGDIEVWNDSCSDCNEDGEMMLEDFSDKDPTWAGSDRLALGKVLLMLRGIRNT
jgi:hypothetical protein